MGCISIPPKHPLPLPMGEVAERSEDGEGKWVRKALSVTFGDSSPGGRAKGLDMLAQEMEHIDTDTAPSTVFTAAHSIFRRLRYFCFLARYASGSMMPFASIFSAQSCRVSTVMEIFSNSS